MSTIKSRYGRIMMMMAERYDEIPSGVPVICVVAFARDIQMDAIPVFGINRLFDFLEILRFGFRPFGNDQMIFRRDHLPGITTGLQPGLAHVRFFRRLTAHRHTSQLSIFLR